MKEKETKQQELQSRRQFFKRAAKTALPILGAILLASTPLKTMASESGMANGRCTACSGSNCGITCRGICRDGCDGRCEGTCLGSCKYTCSGGSK